LNHEHHKTHKTSKTKIKALATGHNRAVAGKPPVGELSPTRKQVLLVLLVL
jgi:hypothetical protein